MAVQLGFALDDVLLSEGYAYSPQYGYETTRDDPGYVTGYTAGYAAGAASVAPITYRMRAYDTTLGQIVFWNSSQVDSAGADYAGPGPLTDVVVQVILGVC